jgi:flagellar biosynthesis anti-sigma factor FlgM
MVIKPIGYSASEMLAGGSTSRVKCGADTRFTPKPGERATLSTDSTAVQSLVASAMQSSGVPLAKLESIKASIRDGTYRMDSAQTAAAILADQA